MEKVNWKVNGMTCSNCALTIHQFLEKKGMKEVKVNLAGGDVSFELNDGHSHGEISKGIESLGYSVTTGKADQPTARRRWFSNHKQRFLFCLVFTIPLMLHMVHNWVHIPLLMNPWVQLALCIPVYIVGMDFFGRSAWKSIRNGMPNMNVLIAIGSTAAFVYSLAGTIFSLGEAFLFYETAATIITLVFLGNYLEDLSIQSTQRALNKLVRSQKVMANMIAYDDEHKEIIFPVENTQLRTGDLILIRTGEQVPADCKILWGTAHANEAIVTGESIPVEKNQKDALIGGSILTDGTVKAQVTANNEDSVLSRIIRLVQEAQGEKPPLQMLADRISAIFVPVVLIISAGTFIVNFIILDAFTPALMRSIAVLVIACPCAMGLATPAAIAVGLGRAARSGILFRNSKSLEVFKSIRQVVFDKTGTLTTGKFSITDFKILTETDETTFKNIVYSLEKYSNHPIAKSIVSAWKTASVFQFKQVEEVKGTGMKGVTQDGNTYEAVNYHAAAKYTDDSIHSIYIIKNNQLAGWIDIRDTIRPEAAGVIAYLKTKGIRTVLLSGDRKETSREIGRLLNIDEVIAEQNPTQKLEVISRLNQQSPVAMVGDGINDAPALAKAAVGISLSEASQLAMQTADVVLMNNGLKNLPEALGIGRHTNITIRQNLFWAFLYNILAIPIAAVGLLTPTFGALVMGLSDVVLAANSVRLFVKKVR
jgi:Cu+-exporting ATPase